MHTVAVPAFKAIAIEQRHEELKIRLLAVMRRSRHQQKMARERGQQLPQAIAFGVLGFTTKDRGRHLVGFVAYHQVPAAIRSLQLQLHVFIARHLVQSGYHEVCLQEPVAGARGFEFVVGQNLEGQMKAAKQFVLPLLGQAARANDEAALQVAACHQLLDKQAGHDGLAGAGIIRQQKAQWLARQHLLIDGGDLVWQRIDDGRMHRQHRIE